MARSVPMSNVPSSDNVLLHTEGELVDAVKRFGVAIDHAEGLGSVSARYTDLVEQQQSLLTALNDLSVGMDQVARELKSHMRSFDSKMKRVERRLTVVGWITFGAVVLVGVLVLVTR